ncbi:unnamed protein product [Polarella glacialis]|uniref:Uncharacterized protein n=1 Tax=Polarella glacialis TaxID=89957 RepID=A0A813FT97_POLGL|nr:unnamed protein product [Polarella glacialis]
MAVQKSVPVLSQLGSMMAPQSTQVIFAMLEMAAELHSNHGSAWSGSIWDANITGIWSNSVDIQQFLFNATPTEILGMGGNSSALPAWWAGKAHAFIAPIEAFATSMSAAVVNDSAESLEALQTYIYIMGLLPADSTFNVTAASGLAKFYTNMLFVQGICHTSMFAIREVLHPFAFPTTADMLPLLAQKLPPSLVTYEMAIAAAYPKFTSQMATKAILSFATAGGLESDAPQLGDGPWSQGDSTAAMQRQLRLARKG